MFSPKDLRSGHVEPSRETRLQNYEVFRRSIWESSDNYDSSNPDLPSAYSRVKGNEFTEIPADFAEGGHVISFASGPDLYRLLHNFPAAGTYHFADYLAWDGEPVICVNEFERRVHSLEGAKIELLDEGFRGRISDEVLKDANSFFKLLNSEGSSITSHPIKWRVVWEDTPVGRQEKIINFRAMNMNSTSHMSDLVNYIGNEGDIRAVMATGVLLPDLDALNIIFERMKKGSLIIDERAQNLPEVFGEWQNPERDKLLEERCRIVHIPEDKPEIFKYSAGINLCWKN